VVDTVAWFIILTVAVLHLPFRRIVDSKKTYFEVVFMRYGTLMAMNIRLTSF
jgi:hypothetical protein